MSALSIGSELGGRYRLVRRIGAGGMGTVYEAIVRGTGARVAVKTLHAGEASRQKAARFRREARAIAAIRHPAVVRTLDVGSTEDGMPFLVMELFSGGTIGALVEREGRIAVPSAIAILDDVLSGLVAAHGAGVIHRDLKPDNVFLHVEDRGVAVKLLDFGIAKIFERRELDTASLTGTGVILGTPEYMAPEQTSGGAVDARVDVYACGLLAYEMLSGRRPFGDLAPQQIFPAILAGAVQPLRRVSEGVPAELAAWVERAMAREPAARFRSAEQALTALRATANVLGLGGEVEAARAALARQVGVDAPSPKAGVEAIEPPRAISAEESEEKTVPTTGRAPTLAFVAGLVVATIASVVVLAPRLRGLPVFDPLRAGAGVMLGALLIGLAWSSFALGAPISRDAETARTVFALGASQALHHFHLALLTIAPQIAARPFARTIGLGAATIATPAMITMTRVAVRARSSPFEAVAWVAAIVAALFAGRSGAETPIAAVTLVTSLCCAGLLERTARSTHDVDRARRVRSLALGFSLHGVLVMAKVLPMLGVAVQVLSLVALLPVGLIAYGVLGIGMVTLSPRRAELGLGLFSRLAVMLLGVNVAVFFVLATPRLGAHTDPLLVAPPLITAAVSLVLAWRVLSVEAPTLRTWLTGLAMGTLGVLKLTFAYAAMMPKGAPVDHNGILWFSRAANTWFVFFVPLTLHLCRLVTRRQSERWILYTAYGLALLVAPLTLSSGYFVGTHSFAFGTVVQGGWGFALFYTVTTGLFAYVVMILIDGIRRAEGGDRTTRTFVATGLFGTSVLVFLDGASVAGADVYPFGNFAFVPLVLLAYGLLRGEIPELSTFVRRGLLHTALSVLLAVTAGALLVTISARTQSSSALIGATTAALVVVVTIEPLRRLGQAGIDRLLGQNFDDQGALERLGRLPAAVEKPRALADEAARLLADTIRATHVTALLEDGGAPDDPALREARRTGAPVRCGAGTSFAMPEALASLGRVAIVLPLATPNRFLGVLAIVPSVSEPLVVASALRFLSSYADLTALLVDRARIHEGIDEEVERRTRALADVIAALERNSSPLRTTVGDEPAPNATTLEQGHALEK